MRDTVKPTSADAVSALRDLGLTPVLLTGDTEESARPVADAVGIDRVHAGVLPEGKAAVIQSLQDAGHVVAMVGDGVNDAPALAQADLGVAIGTGADVAIEASDLTLVSGDLRAAADAIRLSRSTLRTIKGNLFWAFAYNVAAVPLAVAGLLNPIVAGAAMAFSSVFVVTNSLRLRRFRSMREGPDPAAAPVNRITWLGHSTVVVDVDGVRVLTDPLLRNRVLLLRRTTPVDGARPDGSTRCSCRTSTGITSTCHPCVAWDGTSRSSRRVEPAATSADSGSHR